MNYGVKAHGLIELQSAYPNNVPPFELIPFKSVIHNYSAIAKKINRLASDSINDVITAEKFNAELQIIADSVKLDGRAFTSFYKRIATKQWSKVSIRTSALLEDGASHSFAGQYSSFLDITYSRKELEKYVLASFKSLFTSRVITYAKIKGFSSFEIGGSAIVQQMFYGQMSGVLFTEDGQGSVTFAYSKSWLNTTVDGHDATTLKAPKTTLDAKGITRQMKEVAAIGLHLEKLYGHPLDIEWSYDSRRVMLLQMRPQTTGTTQYSLTWDATNISENYPSITLPLTYSFIQNLYAHVYPSFFRLMGMSEKKLKQNSWVFDNTLGYINGRVYYRIENWYELVKLIPGSRNQEFFEEMLNPAKKRAAKSSRTKLTSMINPSLWILAIRFIWLLLRSGAKSRSFSKRFTDNFKRYNRLDWSFMTAESILDHFRDIRQELLVLWGVPILNDVRVMIFHGIFTTSLMKDAPRELYLDQLKGLTDRASIKPLQALHLLGKSIDSAMKQQKINDLSELKRTEAWDDIHTKAEYFIDTFGGRTPDELQLENPRLGENLWDVIQLAYASKDADLSIIDASAPSRFDTLPLFKRLIAPTIVHNLRQAIDYRERFRFNRAQVFGLARSAYLAVGQKLAESGVIVQSEDIFWLTENEVEAVVRGHSWSYDLRKIVDERKREREHYEKLPFWLRATGEGGIAPAAVQDSTPENNSLQGTAGQGVASGIITAPVIVVSKFDPELDVTNKILVVRHIDPGWTLLLLQAAGVVTEQGNPLSHVAIVAREIAIPAVVGVKNAVTYFKTGETITIDGTSGEITHGS